MLRYFKFILHYYILTNEVYKYINIYRVKMITLWYIHFLLHLRDVGRMAEGMLFVRMLIYVSGQTYDILQRSYDEPT